MKYSKQNLMNEIHGQIIGIRIKSHLNKDKHLLEIEIEENDDRLIRWINMNVLIKREK